MRQAGTFAIRNPRKRPGVWQKQTARASKPPRQRGVGGARCSTAGCLDPGWPFEPTPAGDLYRIPWCRHHGPLCRHHGPRVPRIAGPWTTAIRRLLDEDRDPDEHLQGDDWLPNGDDEHGATLKELDATQTVRQCREQYRKLVDWSGSASPPNPSSVVDQIDAWATTAVGMRRVVHVKAHSRGRRGFGVRALRVVCRCDPER
jgi:hypothetical protein